MTMNKEKTFDVIATGGDSSSADFDKDKYALSQVVYPIATTEEYGYPRSERVERQRSPRRYGVVACLEYLVENGLIDKDALSRHLHDIEGEEND